MKLILKQMSILNSFYEHIFKISLLKIFKYFCVNLYT